MLVNVSLDRSVIRVCSLGLEPASHHQLPQNVAQISAVKIPAVCKSVCLARVDKALDRPATQDFAVFLVCFAYVPASKTTMVFASRIAGVPRPVSTVVAAFRSTTMYASVSARRATRTAQQVDAAASSPRKSAYVRVRSPVVAMAFAKATNKRTASPVPRTVLAGRANSATRAVVSTKRAAPTTQVLILRCPVPQRSNCSNAMSRSHVVPRSVANVAVAVRPEAIPHSTHCGCCSPCSSSSVSGYVPARSHDLVMLRQTDLPLKLVVVEV